MTRRLITVIAFVAVQCATTTTPTPPAPAPSAVVSPPSDAVLSTCAYRYWHVAPNARWQYRVSSLGSSYPHPTGSMTFTRIEEIVSVTPGEFRVAFKNSDSAEPPWIKVFRCGESGPAELPNDVERANGYQMSGVFVPADLRIGSEWEDVYATGSSTSTTKYKAEATERVTVPAGTYDAMRVGYVRTDRAGGSTQMTVEGTLWFAPGVGVVREQFKQTTNVAANRSEGQTIEELIAFERGGS